MQRGWIEFEPTDGSATRLTWVEAGRDPGWCKLDWVIADPDGRGLANASNVLDVTWEAPDGTITPLDGYLDPYFQEVYLETEFDPALLAARQGDGSGLGGRVRRATDRRGLQVHGQGAQPREGGAADVQHLPADRAIRRGRLHPGLFDEPVTALYQVAAALLRTLDEAADAGDTFETGALTGQIDDLIMSAIAALDGRAEADMVRRLLRLRDAVAHDAAAADRADDIAGARDDAMRATNAYFERVLDGVPTIKAYLDDVAATHPPD